MREPGSNTGERTFWLVPRRWLLVLAALIVVPWLIVAAFYSRTPNPAADGERGAGGSGAADAPTAVSGAAKPWGQLDQLPIVISPPLEYVPVNWGPIEPPRWHFQGTAADIEQFLTSAGLGAAEAAQLARGAKPEGRGLTLTPDPKLVRDLRPEVRAAIYSELARHPRNERQRNAYRYYAATAEEWLGHSPISPATRRIVEPLIYKVDGFIYFADVDLVRPELADPAELQRLAKGLFRELTMVVRLRLDSLNQVDAAAEYWGRGGRRTDIRPLLESIALRSENRWIDISHLLPAFARQHLYRYPRITLGDLEKPSLVNCFWTALNFFNEVPDDRYLDSEYALARLKRDYFIVHDNLQFGDIAAFVDPAGNTFHAAVYLAENLVFGKNGTSHLSPWTIVPIERLKGYYPEHAGHWQVVFYRRKDF